jgi:hypothetical protein
MASKKNLGQKRGNPEKSLILDFLSPNDGVYIPLTHEHS